MSRNKTIRVIKKNQRNTKREPTQTGGSAREAAREMVETVTNWVNEIQQKRRNEKGKALQALFPDTPRPSEV
jgi:hypothetical protein